MVNVTKLNKTIDELDIKSKEIDKIVKKQNDFHETAMKLKEINNNILIEREKVEKLLVEIEEIFNISKGFSVEIDKKFRENFSEMQNSLKEYYKDIVKLNENVSNIENNISKFNSDTLKKLNEIISENYKMINEFISILETKNNILKTDLLSELRQNIEKLNQQLNSNHNETIDTITNNNKLIVEEILRDKTELNSKYDQLLLNYTTSNKKNNIFQVLIIILMIINLIFMFIR